MDAAGVELSAQLLLINPDFATVFAYRRRALAALYPQPRYACWFPMLGPALGSRPDGSAAQMR
jgi:hypothetical protein